MKLRLNKSTRILNCETDKAFAIKFGKSDIQFVSKKHCMMIPVEQVEMFEGLKWDILIPDWMIEKNEELKNVCRYIYDFNKMNNNNTTDIWNQEKNF